MRAVWSILLKEFPNPKISEIYVIKHAINCLDVIRENPWLWVIL